MNKQLLRHSLVAALTVFTLAGAAGLVLWQNHGVRLYSVQDTAMAPALFRGDLLLSVKQQAVVPGDIVSYIKPDNPGTLITRRVMGTDQAKGVIVTKGDNAALADQPVAAQLVLGTTLKSLPLLGYLLEALRYPVGLAVLIYVPAFMIVRSELRRLSRRLGRQTYILNGFTSVARQPGL